MGFLLAQKYRCLVRFISINLAFIFLLNTVVEAAPLMQHVMTPSVLSQSAINSFSQPPYLPLSPIQINSQIGSVQESYLPVTKKDSPQVYLIQDAHESLDAQENIKNILEKLVLEEGVDTLLFEGGSLDFNSSIYQFSSDMEINHRMWKELFRQGHLSGVELFALNQSGSVRLKGIEDESIYFKNLKTILDTNRLYKKSQDEILRIDQQYTIKKQKTFSEPLRKLIKERDDFRKNKNNFNPYMLFLMKEAKKRINLDLSQAKYQKQYPQLVRYSKISQFEKKIKENRDEVEKQRIELLELTQNKVAKSLTKESFLFLFNPEQHYLARDQLRWYFESWCEWAQAENIDVQLYSHFINWMAYHILKNEMKGPQLFDELQTIEILLLKNLNLSEEERKLLAEEDGWNLWNKLVSLKLTREEYERLRDTNPKNDLKGLNLLTQKALENYEWVIKRDAVLSEKAIEAINLSKSSRVAVVTGGFHSYFLTQKLKEEKKSYVLIAPRISQLERSLNYKDRIQQLFSSTTALDIPGALLSDLSKQRLLVAARSLGIQGAKKKDLPRKSGAQREDEIFRTHISVPMPEIEQMLSFPGRIQPSMQNALNETIKLIVTLFEDALISVNRNEVENLKRFQKYPGGIFYNHLTDELRGAISNSLDSTLERYRREGISREFIHIVFRVYKDQESNYFIDVIDEGVGETAINKTNVKRYSGERYLGKRGVDRGKSLESQVMGVFDAQLFEREDAQGAVLEIKLSQRKVLNHFKESMEGLNLRRVSKYMDSYGQSLGRTKEAYNMRINGNQVNILDAMMEGEFKTTWLTSFKPEALPKLKLPDKKESYSLDEAFIVFRQLKGSRSLTKSAFSAWVKKVLSRRASSRISRELLSNLVNTFSLSEARTHLGGDMVTVREKAKKAGAISVEHRMFISRDWVDRQRIYRYQLVPVHLLAKVMGVSKKVLLSYLEEPKKRFGDYLWEEDLLKKKSLLEVSAEGTKYHMDGAGKALMVSLVTAYQVISIYRKSLRNKKESYSVDELAGLLGVTKNILAQAIKSGEIAVIHLPFLGPEPRISIVDSEGILNIFSKVVKNYSKVLRPYTKKKISSWRELMAVVSGWETTNSLKEKWGFKSHNGIHQMMSRGKIKGFHIVHPLTEQGVWYFPPEEVGRVDDLEEMKLAKVLKMVNKGSRAKIKTRSELEKVLHSYFSLEKLEKRWSVSNRSLKGMIQRGTLEAVRLDFIGEQKRGYLVSPKEVKRIEGLEQKKLKKIKRFVSKFSSQTIKTIGKLRKVTQNWIKPTTLDERLGIRGGTVRQAIDNGLIQAVRMDLIAFGGDKSAYLIPTAEIKRLEGKVKALARDISAFSKSKPKTIQDIKTATREWLRIEDLAKEFDVSFETIFALVRSGEITAFKLDLIGLGASKAPYVIPPEEVSRIREEQNEKKRKVLSFVEQYENVSSEDEITVMRLKDITSRWVKLRQFKTEFGVHLATAFNYVRQGKVNAVQMDLLGYGGKKAFYLIPPQEIERIRQEDKLKLTQIIDFVRTYISSKRRVKTWEDVQQVTNSWLKIEDLVKAASVKFATASRWVKTGKVKGIKIKLIGKNNTNGYYIIPPQEIDRVKKERMDRNNLASSLGQESTAVVDVLYQKYRFLLPKSVQKQFNYELVAGWYEVVSSDTTVLPMKIFDFIQKVYSLLSPNEVNQVAVLLADFQKEITEILTADESLEPSEEEKAPQEVELVKAVALQKLVEKRPLVDEIWEGDKKARISMDPVFWGVLHSDEKKEWLKKIKKILTRNYSSLKKGLDYEEPIGGGKKFRSLKLGLVDAPLVLSHGVKIHAMQLKGVVFDSGNITDVFNMHHAKREWGQKLPDAPVVQPIYHEDGTISYIPRQWSPKGGMVLDEAKREFEMHRYFMKSGMPVNYPLAYGEFLGEKEPLGRKIGFVLLGQRFQQNYRFHDVLNRILNARYVVPIQELSKEGKTPEEIESLFRETELELLANIQSHGHLLRTIHTPMVQEEERWEGAFHGNLHPANVSVDPDYFLNIHDLTHAYNKEEVSSLKEQFARQLLDFDAALSRTLEDKVFMDSQLQDFHVRKGLPVSWKGMEYVKTFLLGYFYDFPPEVIEKVARTMVMEIEGHPITRTNNIIQKLGVTRLPAYQHPDFIFDLMRYVVGIKKDGTPLLEEEKESAKKEIEQKILASSLGRTKDHFNMTFEGHAFNILDEMKKGNFSMKWILNFKPEPLTRIQVPDKSVYVSRKTVLEAAKRKRFGLPLSAKRLEQLLKAGAIKQNEKGELSRYDAESFINAYSLRETAELTGLNRDRLSGLSGSKDRMVVVQGNYYVFHDWIEEMRARHHRLVPVSLLSEMLNLTHSTFLSNLRNPKKFLRPHLLRQLFDDRKNLLESRFTGEEYHYFGDHSPTLSVDILTAWSIFQLLQRVPNMETASTVDELSKKLYVNRVFVSKAIEEDRVEATLVRGMRKGGPVYLIDEEEVRRIEKEFNQKLKLLIKEVKAYVDSKVPLKTWEDIQEVVKNWDTTETLKERWNFKSISGIHEMMRREVLKGVNVVNPLSTVGVNYFPPQEVEKLDKRDRNKLDEILEFINRYRGSPITTRAEIDAAVSKWSTPTYLSKVTGIPRQTMTRRVKKGAVKGVLLDLIGFKKKFMVPPSEAQKFIQANSKISKASSLGRSKDHFDATVLGEEVNLLDAMKEGAFKVQWFFSFKTKKLPRVEIPKKQKYLTKKEVLQLVSQVKGKRRIGPLRLNQLIEKEYIKRDSNGNLNREDVLFFLNAFSLNEAAAFIGVNPDRLGKIALENGSVKYGKEYFVPYQWVELLRANFHDLVPIRILAEMLDMEFWNLVNKLRSPSNYFSEDIIKEFFPYQETLIDKRITGEEYHFINGNNVLAVDLATAWMLFVIFRMFPNPKKAATLTSLANKLSVNKTLVSTAVKEGRIKATLVSVLKKGVPSYLVDEEEFDRVIKEYSKKLKDLKALLVPYLRGKQLKTWQDIQEVVQGWDTAESLKEKWGFNQVDRIHRMVKRGLLKGVHVVNPLSVHGKWYFPPSEVEKVDVVDREKLQEALGFVNRYRKRKIRTREALIKSLKRWSSPVKLSKSTGIPRQTMTRLVRDGYVEHVKLDILGQRSRYVIPPEAAKRFIDELNEKIITFSDKHLSPYGQGARTYKQLKKLLNRWYTISELSKTTGINQEEIAWKVEIGELNSVNFDFTPLQGRIYIPPQEAEKLIQSSSVSANSLGVAKEHFDIFVNGKKVNLIDAMVDGSFRPEWISRFVPKSLHEVSLKNVAPSITFERAEELSKRLGQRVITVYMLSELQEAGIISKEFEGMISKEDLQFLINSRKLGEAARLVELNEADVWMFASKHGAKRLRREYFVPLEWIEEVMLRKHHLIPVQLLVDELGVNYASFVDRLKNPRKHFSKIIAEGYLEGRDSLLEPSLRGSLVHGNYQNFMIDLSLAWKVVRLIKEKSLSDGYITSDVLAERIGVDVNVILLGIRNELIKVKEISDIAGSGKYHYAISEDEAERIEKLFSAQLAVYQQTLEESGFIKRKLNGWKDLKKFIQSWLGTEQLRQRWGFTGNQAIMQMYQRGSVWGLELAHPLSRTAKVLFPLKEIRSIERKEKIKFELIAKFISEHVGVEVNEKAEMSDVFEDWYTVNDLLKATGYSRKKVMRQINNGNIPSIKIDLLAMQSRIVIPPTVAQLWIGQQQKPPSTASSLGRTTEDFNITVNGTPVNLLDAMMEGTFQISYLLQLYQPMKRQGHAPKKAYYSIDEVLEIFKEKGRGPIRKLHINEFVTMKRRKKEDKRIRHEELLWLLNTVPLKEVTKSLVGQHSDLRERALEGGAVLVKDRMFVPVAWLSQQQEKQANLVSVGLLAKVMGVYRTKLFKYILDPQGMFGEAIFNQYFQDKESLLELSQNGTVFHGTQKARMITLETAWAIVRIYKISLERAKGSIGIVALGEELGRDRYFVDKIIRRGEIDASFIPLVSDGKYKDRIVASELERIRALYRRSLASYSDVLKKYGVGPFKTWSELEEFFESWYTADDVRRRFGFKIKRSVYDMSERGVLTGIHVASPLMPQGQIRFFPVEVDNLFNKDLERVNEILVFINRFRKRPIGNKSQIQRAIRDWYKLPQLEKKWAVSDGTLLDSINKGSLEAINIGLIGMKEQGYWVPRQEVQRIEKEQKKRREEILKFVSQYTDESINTTKQLKKATRKWFAVEGAAKRLGVKKSLIKSMIKRKTIRSVKMDLLGYGGGNTLMMIPPQEIGRIEREEKEKLDRIIADISQFTEKPLMTVEDVLRATQSWVKAEEFAKEFGVNTAHVLALIRSNKIRAVEMNLLKVRGNKMFYLIPLSEVERFKLDQKNQLAEIIPQVREYTDAEIDTIEGLKKATLDWSSTGDFSREFGFPAASVTRMIKANNIKAIRFDLFGFGGKNRLYLIPPQEVASIRQEQERRFKEVQNYLLHNFNIEIMTLTDLEEVTQDWLGKEDVRRALKISQATFYSHVKDRKVKSVFIDLLGYKRRAGYYVSPYEVERWGGESLDEGASKRKGENIKLKAKKIKSKASSLGREIALLVAEEYPYNQLVLILDRVDSSSDYAEFEIRSKKQKIGEGSFFKGDDHWNLVHFELGSEYNYQEEGKEVIKWFARYLQNMFPGSRNPLRFGWVYNPEMLSLAHSVFEPDSMEIIFKKPGPWYSMADPSFNLFYSAGPLRIYDDVPLSTKEIKVIKQGSFYVPVSYPQEVKNVVVSKYHVSARYKSTGNLLRKIQFERPFSIKGKIRKSLLSSARSLGDEQDEYGLTRKQKEAVHHFLFPKDLSGEAILKQVLMLLIPYILLGGLVAAVMSREKKSDNQAVPQSTSEGKSLGGTRPLSAVDYFAQLEQELSEAWQAWDHQSSMMDMGFVESALEQKTNYYALMGLIANSFMHFSTPTSKLEEDDVVLYIAPNQNGNTGIYRVLSVSGMQVQLMNVANKTILVAETKKIRRIDLSKPRIMSQVEEMLTESSSANKESIRLTVKGESKKLYTFSNSYNNGLFASVVAMREMDLVPDQALQSLFRSQMEAQGIDADLTQGEWVLIFANKNPDEPLDWGQVHPISIRWMNRNGKGPHSFDISFLRNMPLEKVFGDFTSYSYKISEQLGLRNVKNFDEGSRLGTMVYQNFNYQDFVRSISFDYQLFPVEAASLGGIDGHRVRSFIIKKGEEEALLLYLEEPFSEKINMELALQIIMGRILFEDEEMKLSYQYLARDYRVSEQEVRNLENILYTYFLNSIYFGGLLRLVKNSKMDQVKEAPILHLNIPQQMVRVLSLLISDKQDGEQGLPTIGALLTRDPNRIRDVFEREELNFDILINRLKQLDLEFQMKLQSKVSAQKKRKPKPTKIHREARKQVAQLFLKPEGYRWSESKRSFDELEGLNLGPLTKRGMLYLNPRPNYNLILSLLDKEEAGWELSVVRSEVLSNRLILTVQLSHSESGKIMIRDIRLVPSKKMLRGLGADNRKEFWIYWGIERGPVAIEVRGSAKNAHNVKATSGREVKLNTLTRNELLRQSIEILDLTSLSEVRLRQAWHNLSSNDVNGKSKLLEMKVGDLVNLKKDDFRSVIGGYIAFRQAKRKLEKLGLSLADSLGALFKDQYGVSEDIVLKVVKMTGDVIGLDLKVYFPHFYNELLKKIQNKDISAVNRLLVQLGDDPKLNDLLSYLDRGQTPILVTSELSPRALILQLMSESVVIVDYKDEAYKQQFDRLLSEAILKQGLTKEETRAIKDRAYFIRRSKESKRQDMLTQLFKGERVSTDRGLLSLSRMAHDLGVDVRGLRRKVVWMEDNQMIDEILERLIVGFGLPMVIDPGRVQDNEQRDFVDTLRLSVASWLSLDPEFLVKKGYASFKDDRFVITEHFFESFLNDQLLKEKVNRLLATMA